jgi:VCBS repeat-containing protein
VSGLVDGDFVFSANQAPVFTGHGLASHYQPNGAAVAIVDQVVASDIDSANYAGGSLTATVTQGGHEGDMLSIANSPYITTSGTTVWFDSDGPGEAGAIIIGTLTDGINSLTIDLNDHATDAAVDALAQAIQFENGKSDAQAGTRTVTFALHDGGGTAHGGQDSDFFNATVNVTAPNHPATIDGPSSASLIEDRIIYASGMLTAHDVDSGEDHFQTVSPTALRGDYGSFTFNANSGIWTYTVDHSKADSLAADHTVHDRLTVTTADGTASQVICVAITGTNDAPVITGHDLMPGYVAGGDAVSIVDTIAVTDVDNTNYDGGSLNAAVTNASDGDMLTIGQNDFIYTEWVNSGIHVMFDADGDGDGEGAVDIGQLFGNGSSLSVDLTADATNTAVDVLAQSIRFESFNNEPEAGTRNVTFTLNDGAGTTDGGHDTASFDATVDVQGNIGGGDGGPVLNSMTLNIVEGGTTVLSNDDFSVTDPGFTSFLYSVQDVTGGQFEVFNGDNWVLAETGGFTTEQIAAGEVRFVQDGSDAAPDFSIWVGDGGNVSPAIAPTVNFSDAPVISTDFIRLAAETDWGGLGQHQGAAITYADGHLYLSFNNGAETQTTSDSATIFGFNTEPSGLSGWTFAYPWNKGDFSGIAAGGNELYLAGESNPGFGLTTDNAGDVETKSILVRFDADGPGDGDPFATLGDTANNFYPYSGVEGFQNIIATTQSGNTILYAVGSGQPQSYSGYIIAEYSSSGALLNSATDSLASDSNRGGSSANGAVDWNGALWVVGSSDHPNLGDTYGHATVWTASYDLSSVVMHEDDTGVSAAFNGVATIGSGLYAVGYANVAVGQSDYLIAKYNTDGSVAWSKTFGDGHGDTLTGAVTLNGHLYVVGSAMVGSTTEGVLMEIDPTSGNVLSTIIYDPEQYNSFTSITTDGHHLYVAGVSGPIDIFDQTVVLTYDVGGATAAAVEDTALAISSLAVSDMAAGSEQIEVTLAVGHGTIMLENSSGLDNVVGVGTGSVELLGSQAAINAALAHGVVYNPASNYIGSDTLAITANDQGHNASGVAQSTTESVSISVAPAISIADGATYTVNGASGDTIAFASGHGTLDIVQHSTFTGAIAGISGSGDVLEMPGFVAATTTAVTGVGSYDSTFNTTTLMVTDTDSLHTHFQSQSLTLAGDYSNSTWIVTDDGHGGVYIVDPPGTADAAVGPVVAHDPGPAAGNMIVANAPNETLTGTDASDTFVFKFTGFGHDTVADFHPAADTLQFAGAMFANAQGAFNATHDDGQGNTVVSVDAHNTITLTGILKAQLHTADFHVI